MLTVSVKLRTVLVRADTWGERMQKTRRKGYGGFKPDANPEECLSWTGNLNASGYGRIWVDYSDLGKKQRYVHRMAWESFFGPIPEGYEIDHLCCNPACYYIKHLDLVTRLENKRRADRRVTHCPRRHEYTPDNTYVSKTNNRMCRECHRQRSRGVMLTPAPGY